jgi:hypothetical protein
MPQTWFRLGAFIALALAISIASLLQASATVSAKGNAVLPAKGVIANQGPGQVPDEDGEEDGGEDGEEDGPTAPQPATPSGAGQPTTPSQAGTTQGVTVCPDGTTLARATGPVTFEVQASGAQEVPVVTSPGSAFARFTFDESSGRLTFFATVFGLSPNLVTAAHIHRGAVGVNGPIVHFLSATGFTQVAGELTLSAADIADLKAGNFYFNAHSVDHPGGFARAQMFLPAAAQADCPAPAPRTIAPPRTGDGGLLDVREGTSIAYAALVTLVIAGVAGMAIKRREV